MSKKLSIKVPDEVYTQIEFLVSSGEYDTITNFVNDAISLRLKKDTHEVEVLSSEEVKRVQLLEEQLKQKDKQIMALLSIQQELSEKVGKQVQLLADRTTSKKWYEFWK